MVHVLGFVLCLVIMITAGKVQAEVLYFGVTYTEADNRVWNDLSHTTIYGQLGGNPSEELREVTATSPGGNGDIVEMGLCITGAPAGTSTIFVMVTATDFTGNISLPATASATLKGRELCAPLDVTPPTPVAKFEVFN